MTRRKHEVTNVNYVDNSKPQAIQATLTSERLEKLAYQVAIGNEKFPSDLRTMDCRQLIFRVAEIRRERLVTFIVFEIAMDIAKSRKASRS